MRISDWSSDVCSSDLGDHLTWGAFTKFAHQPNRYFRPGEPAQHTLGGFKPRARTGLGASIALFRMRAPCYYLSITLESQAMGMRADRDLWGQALAIESQYGDRGLEVIARKIDELHRAGRYRSEEHTTELQPLMRTSYTDL